MKKVLLALLLLSCGIAQATEGPIYVVSPPHPSKPEHKQDKRQSIANKNAAAAAAAASAAVDTRATANIGSQLSTQTTGNQSLTSNMERSASTAYAASIAPTAVCMGTSSAGVQGLALGVSVGSSWTDQNCMLLEQVRTVATVLQDKITAEEMMCGMEQYRMARIRVGKPCSEDSKQRLHDLADKQITDPAIRYRLGLAPMQ